MAIRKQKEPKMASDDKSKNAGFISRVVGDPSNPPETRLLTGWLGDAADAGYRRLYTDPELASYVDIPEDAILYTEEIRDVQPSGGVYVWVRRDAGLKQGGSAASRAGRFLQGQVAQDFSTPEKAGLRCVTQEPCAEVTGFTGKCTEQPYVGGAWPCITALPLCSAEPTGFTGKCTEQPWPNPTRYYGCTYLHCPTHDLTQQPHICNIIASGAPGCGPQPDTGGGDKKEGEAGAESAEAARPVTALPGCGYTKTWGLCETHLLGCGYTKDPSVQCTNIPGCVTFPNGDCTFFGCGPGGAQADAAHQEAPGGAAPQPISVTMFVCCNPSVIDACPTRFHCPTPNTQCTHGGPECRTHQAPHCPTHQPCCTQTGLHCPTSPLQECTMICTHAGPNCPQTPMPVCAQTIAADEGVQPAAGANIQFTPPVTIPIWNCVPPTPATRCFICPPRSPLPWHCPPTRQVFCQPSLGIACTIVQCGPGGGGGGGFGVEDVQGGGGAEAAQALPISALIVQCHTRFEWQCAPTPATRCFICPPKSPLLWQCPPSRFCGGGVAFDEGSAEAIAQPNIPISLQIAQCPTRIVWQCAPTPATRCFICPPFTRQVLQCNPSAVDACPTRFGCPTQIIAQCNPSAVDACPTRFGCPTRVIAQCNPSAVDACPTWICGGGVEDVQGGGGGAEAAQANLPISAFVVQCHTRFAWQCAPTPATRCFICPPKTLPWHCAPTPATACFICPPFTQSIQCAGGGGGGGVAFDEGAVAEAPQAIAPTPATRCFICQPYTQQVLQCNPSAVDACPTRIGCPTRIIAECNPSAVDACPTRFNCPTQLAVCQVNTFFPCTTVGCFPTFRGCPTPP
jgi:hypothetical protein